MPLNPLELNYLQTLYQKADKDQKAEFVKSISGEPPEKRPPGLCTFDEHFASTVNIRVCPHCGANTTVKDGKHTGKQRFLCRNCQKTFGFTTGRVPFATKKPFATWQRFMRCLAARKALRAAARECHISLPTAWSWKRRFLDQYIAVAMETAHDLQKSILGYDSDCPEVERAVRKQVTAMFKTRRKRRRPKLLRLPIPAPTPEKRQ